MTEVEFFFDPSCPFTWVTSRWLATVAPERDLAVTWRTWSLPIKNQGRELPDSMPAALREQILAGQAFSVGALRVLAATDAAAGNEAVGRLYTEMGRRFHPDGHRGANLIADALAAAGLPSNLAAAAEEGKWDEPTRANMADVRDRIGDDVGVPIVAVRGPDGLAAMSGPIMTDVPPRDRALALWDAVATVVAEPAVSELKRHRTSGPSAPELGDDGRVA